MAVVLAVHALLGFGLLGARVLRVGPRLGRLSMLAGAAASVVALVWWAAHLSTVLDGGVATETWTWVGALGLAFDLRFDGFAALMVAIVSGIGVLVFVYAAFYFDGEDDGVDRLAGVMTLFSGAMLGVVLADNLIVIYGFWELTSITSYLLIGNWFKEPRARAAAMQAIIVTGAGALAMLLGFVMLGESAGTYSLSAILADPPTGGVVTAALVLIAIGAFTKSAQYPFHSWLPAAMVAPTPVSAYLHSATMVKAGVYLIARLAPVFALASGWRPLMLVVGSLTMVAGGLRALRQYDLKLLLAHGTVSQLGFMVLLFGVGTPQATLAGCAVLLAHAMFKAALFLIVGAVDHGTGTRDIREIPPLDRSWDLTKGTAIVAAASMAGVPLAFGFVAKELGFEAFADGGFTGSGWALAVIVTGSALTAAYAARFVAGLFGRWSVRRPVPSDATSAVPRSVHAPGGGLIGPVVVLAIGTLVLGVVPSLVDGLVGDAAVALDAGVGAVSLALWHGFNLPLLLSAITLVAGGVLYVGRSSVDLVLAWGSRIPTGGEVYRSTMRGLDALAGSVTGVVQSGSLPAYVGVILATAALLPGAALVVLSHWEGWPKFIESWVDIPIVAVLIGAALGAAIVRHRISAALLLGAAGYAMTALFVVQGAPDLALTQAGVETLTTLLFVLALRYLPRRFERRSIPFTRALRIIMSVAVGTLVFGFALLASSSDPPREVSTEMIDRAVPDAAGENVVNVILVDFRGLDTLGEISVVAVGAIGAVALARAGQVPRPAPRRSEAGPAGTTRHMFVDIVVRVLVYVALVVSVYLLVAGHNAPGGGFVGGLVAGAAFALRYISGGLDEVRGMVRARPWTILGAGLLIAGVTATVPLLFGEPFLENGKLELDLPLIGDVGVTSGLAFDVGVYLVVVGLVFMVFEAFGGYDRTRTSA